MFIKTSVPVTSGFHANILQRHTAYYKDSQRMSDEHGFNCLHDTIFIPESSYSGIVHTIVVPKKLA